MTHLSRETLEDWRNEPTDALRAVVVPHLAGCSRCAAVYADLVRAEAPEASPMHFDPEDFAARGLQVGTRALAGSSWSRVWERAGQLVTSIGRSVLDSSAPVRWALAGQFVLILALGALVLSRSQPSIHTTLSGGTVDETGTRVSVVFEPAASSEAIRQTLGLVGGSIVSGPSAAGVYVVLMPLPAESPEVDASIETLRRNTGVIRFAEREP